MPEVAAVVIGRNEGARLVQCFASIGEDVAPIVYVDSGSTDGSLDAARAAGADIVELDMSRPFTAARARNAGLAHLKKIAPDAVFVQVLDGDCALDPEWVSTARKVLEASPETAVVCGRRRERFPDATIWNGLIDAEWDTPVGEALSCGGDALLRRSAIEGVGGYRPDLIAGEEPEMCLRLRKTGWKIRRIDAEMTLHDAAMTRWSQWWNRSRRAGHAFAEVSTLHRAEPGAFWVPETKRALVWGAVMPVVFLAGSLVSPWALAGFLAWPAQVLRLAVRDGSWQGAFFLMMGKLPEAQGVLEYQVSRFRGRQSELIEYK